MAGSFEEERGDLLHIIAELYARGRLSEATMGDLIERVTAAEPGGLETIAKELPLEGALDLALRSSILTTQAQVIGGEGSVVRKTGEWLESRHLEISGRASVYRLDLSSYAGMRGLALELHLEVMGCSVIIKLPRRFKVKESIEDSRGSVVKIKGKEGKAADCLLVLKGRIQGSVVKILLR
jgi:hypothetical protein